MADQWIRVTVHPRAKRDVLIRVGEGRFEAWVKARPVEGAANAAVAGLLSRGLQIAQEHLRLVKGWNGRHKIFQIGSV